MSETNAERIAHILSNIEDARLHNGTYSSNHIELGWLIEQALHAERLVKMYNEQGRNLSLRSHENHFLREENKKFREALEEITKYINDYYGQDYATIALEALGESE